MYDTGPSQKNETTELFPGLAVAVVLHGGSDYDVPVVGFVVPANDGKTVIVKVSHCYAPTEIPQHLIGLSHVADQRTDGPLTHLPRL